MKIAFILSYAFIIVGWIANIVQVIALINEPLTTLLALKCVGILVFPVGVILGWIGIF